MLYFIHGSSNLCKKLCNVDSHFKVDLPGPTLDGAPSDWIGFVGSAPLPRVGAILGGDASDGRYLGVRK